MSKEERLELKKKLREFHGSLTQVAKRAELSHPFVLMVLNGSRNSEKVLTIATQVLVECMKKKLEGQRLQKQNLQLAKDLAAQTA